jgi:hypothetical protein
MKNQKRQLMTIVVVAVPVILVYGIITMQSYKNGVSQKLNEEKK